MHLAYLDDSDTRNKRSKWQVMSAVIIEDKSFKTAEVGITVAQRELSLSPEQLEKFEEFHACELYGGFGAFEGIEQQRRFEAMKRLLFLPDLLDMDIVYGAVNLEKLKSEIYASADPVDICFRICVRGINSVMAGQAEKKLIDKLGTDVAKYTDKNVIPIMAESALEDLTLLILDECDNKTKANLQKTFRSAIRPKKQYEDNLFSVFHDDMYFGDSRYSAGIQIADACSYFIGRHLDRDEETDSFYRMIEPRIVHSEIHPSEGELEQLAHLSSLKGENEDDQKQ